MLASPPFHDVAAASDANHATFARSAYRVVRNITITSLFAISGATFAAPGALDTAFGAGTGKVITAIGAASDVANGVAIQPDGKIVLAGTCSNGSNGDFCLARYNADGTLDTGFNGTGKVITAIGTSEDFASSLVIQPDGKIVLAGYCFNGANQDFCLARYTSTGALDASFNSTGKVVTAITASSDDYLSSLALQPDGKIIAAGYCFVTPGYDFCLARYNANGTLDTTFNGTGKLIVPVGGGNDVGNSVVVQSDGKIIMAGYCANGGNQDFCLVRFNADGTLDTGFNSTGKLLSAIGTSNDYATRVILQPDGKIIASGYCYNATANNVCFARYNPNGTLDTTLNGTGKVLTPISGGNDDSTSAVIQPDGKIVVVGTCTASDFCTARYNNDGSLDVSFNATGKVITPVGTGNDVAKAVALQSDGKIIVAGYCAGGTNDFCLVRYEGDVPGARQCSLDIDGDGQVLATTDSLIHARIALGMNGPAVVNGINFPATARRNTWPLVRDFLVNHCGIVLIP